MSFASVAEFLTHAQSQGLFTSDQIADLLKDDSLPNTPDEFISTLRDRGMLSSESIEELLVAPQIETEPFPAVEMLSSTEESAEAFVPTAVTESETNFADVSHSSTTSQRVAGPVMSREKLYTWFALGGALWLFGFIILGAWLGGCLDSQPAARPSKSIKS